MSRHGWTTLPGLGCVETQDLVTRIRRLRGRKTVREIVIAFGLPDSRPSWLRIWGLCRDYEIATADTDDPEYYRKTIQADRAQEQRALIRARLAAEIARARAEAPTAPLYRAWPP